MHIVDNTYTTLLSQHNHIAEWKVEINGVSYMDIKNLSIKSSVFGNTPTVGMCVSAEIDLVMVKPAANIPKMARIRPYVRLTDGTTNSLWIPKGIFYIDTRSCTKNDTGIELLTIHGYDAMLKAEQDSPIDGFPKTDINTVLAIANVMGVPVDNSVNENFDKGYTVQTPIGYSCREVLGYLAASYAGCFVVDDDGNLRFIRINGFPDETNYLINTAGQRITFGGVRIIV